MSHASGERGYIYQEVLVALAILGFALTAVSPLYILGVRRSAVALDVRVSTVLAQAELETLRTRAGTSLYSAGDVVRVGNADFLRSWQVRRSDPYPPLTTVTVSVQARRGRILGRMTTLKARFAEVVP